MVWCVMSCTQVFSSLSRGKFAEQQQVGDFQKGAALGQHFDGISAIAQNSLVAIDEGDALGTMPCS